MDTPGATHSIVLCRGVTFSVLYPERVSGVKEEEREGEEEELILQETYFSYSRTATIPLTTIQKVFLPFLL
jgi:hypothetical protein